MKIPRVFKTMKIPDIKQFFKNQRVKQVMALSMVNVIGIPLSVISSIIITRYLGPTAYGDYKFLINVFSLAGVIFGFGFFYAGNRALVLNNDVEKGKEFYGSMLAIVVMLFLLMSISLFSYAFIDNNIQVKGLRNIFLIFIPFSVVFVMDRYFEVLFPADNKIKLLANTRLYSKLVYFIAIIILYFFFKNFSANKLITILIAFFLPHIIVYIYIVHKIRPSFKHFFVRLNELLSFNKSYGFNVYIGRISSVGFSQLTGILISYFAIDNSGVGYFSLAATISMPLSFIPNVIATTHYKDFSTSKKIPKKLIWVTILISATALFFIFILVNPFINYFYRPDFQPVVSLAYILSFGVILSGLADFFNRFLGAHGKGEALRNSSILVGLSTMAFNLLLIPEFGETGAAYTRFFSGLIYLLSMVWYYKKLINTLKES